MRVQVNLGDSLVKKVDEYAKEMGVTRSSFCAMIIGQTVMSYDKAFEMLGNAVNNTIKEAKTDET